MKFATKTLVTVLIINFALVLSWDQPRFATPGQFPHQISMSWSLPPEIPLIHSCGGVILNKLWILTSGYCITNVPNLGIVQIKAGVHNISDNDEHVQSREIEKMVVHEKYPAAHTLINLALHDLGLIKLKTELIFNDRVKSILLPKPASWLSKKKLSFNLILSGWGSLTYGVLTEHPEIIRTVNVPVISNKICQDSIKTIFNTFKMSSTQMCTRPIDGSLAACIGDFGGPVIEHEIGKEPVIVGILSWSSEPCNTNGLPPVYTRIAYYTKWIEKKLKENNYTN